MTNILRIDASARNAGSTTRQLADQLVTRLIEQGYGANVVRRDLALTPPALLTETWVGANFTDDADRNDDQKAALAHSDEPIAELEAADTIVIGAQIVGVRRGAESLGRPDRPRPPHLPLHRNRSRRSAQEQARLSRRRLWRRARRHDHGYASRYVLQLLGFVGVTDGTGWPPISG